MIWENLFVVYSNNQPQMVYVLDTFIPKKRNNFVVLIWKIFLKIDIFCKKELICKKDIVE